MGLSRARERVDLTGRQVLIVHGDADRVASPTNAAAVARDLARTADVGFVTVEGGSHAMLRHHGVFDGLAADFAATTLLGADPSPTIARVLAGERWLAV